MSRSPVGTSTPSIAFSSEARRRARTAPPVLIPTRTSDSAPLLRSSTSWAMRRRARRTSSASITYPPLQRVGIGVFSVSPHGLGTAGGFLLGALLMGRAAERRGVPRAEVYNAVTWGAVGALIGARGFYVLAHRHDFSSVGEILAVWRGGLTMFGGFAGGLALGVGYLRRKGIDVPKAMDAAAPGFVAGVATGRVGDLIIADH